MSSFTHADIEAMEAVVEAEDAKYRATLTPERLRAYRLWLDEIAAHCPGCHRDDVEVRHDSGPDMVGSWWTANCDACGYLLDSGSDGLEAVR